MVRALNLGVLLKGMNGARWALILHSGGGVQEAGGAMVMVSCIFLLISLFWNFVSKIPCIFLVCLLRTSLLLNVLLKMEHWYCVAVDVIHMSR